MNKTVTNGKVQQMRRQIEQGRGQVAGNTPNEAVGKFGRLVSTLQRKYGYDRERAAKEIQRRLGKHATGGRTGAGHQAGNLPTRARP